MRKLIDYTTNTGKTVLFAAGVLILTGWFSCKRKTDPQPVVQNPKLTATMLVDGSPLQFHAGVNGYVLKPSYELQQDDYHYFIGSFENEAGGPSLKIGFKDYKMRTAGESVDFENVLSTGGNANTLIRDTTWQNQTLQQMSFSSYSKGQNLSYNWNFGDGTTQTTSLGGVTHNYASAGTYSVSLQITDGTCSDVITKNVTTETMDSTCYPTYTPWVSFDTNGTAYAQFSPDTTGTNPSFFWDFGNGYVDSVNIQPNTVYDPPGIYTVCITKTDGACTYKRCENIAFAQAQPSCIANFNSSYLGQSTVTSSEQLGNVFLELTLNGVTYSSRMTGQSTPNVTINSITEYLVSDSGDPTKKIDLELDCTLANNLGETISISNAKMTVAVAYF